MTLWYAALLVVMCALLFAGVQWFTRATEEEYVRSTLDSAAAVIMDELEYEDTGGWSSDEDSLKRRAERLRGAVFAGRAADLRPRSTPAACRLRKARCSRAEGGGHSWYVLDRRMDYESREDVWLRLCSSTDASWSARLSSLRYGFWALPALIAVALAGGWLLTARAFRPVKRMTALAASIADGSDLSRRIGGRGRLAATSCTRWRGRSTGCSTGWSSAFRREQRFTSDVAHELRTPLNAVATQCEFGLSRAGAREKDAALEKILEKERRDGRAGAPAAADRAGGVGPDADGRRLSDGRDAGGESRRILAPVAQERGMRIAVRGGAVLRCGETARCWRGRP